MIVSHIHKFLYYGAPKTASTSLHRFFEQPEWSGDTSWKPLNRQHTVAIPPGTESYLKWTVVRNPYNRMVSLWRHRLNELMAAGDGDGYHKLTFLEFLRTRHTMGRFFAVSQWDFFKEVNIYPDVVLKFMDLPDCLRKLPFVTSDLSIPRINRTKHAPFMEYYSREEEILVWEQEREDFEQFQYERLQPIVRRVLCPVENQYKL